MRRLIALLVGALIGVSLVVAPAQPALAGSTNITGDGWTMTISASDESWSALFLPNFFPCNDLHLAVTVTGPAVSSTTEWTLSVDVRPRGASTPTAAFDVPGTGSGTFPITGARICEDFNAPDAHPDGLYDLTGAARVPKDSSATSSPSPATFTVTKMASSIMLQGYSNQTGASVFTGRVSQWQSMIGGGFYRPATGGAVVLEQLANGSWTKVSDGVWTGDGWFSASAGTILPIGTYIRVTYTGDFSIAPLTGFPYEVRPLPVLPTPAPVLVPPAPAPVVQPKATVKIRAVSARSKLKVDVNPNIGTKYWTFQIQRKNPDGSWKALKTYRTQGAKETRTVNLRKGTYRVWVNPKLWYQGAMSANEVTLKR